MPPDDRPPPFIPADLRLHRDVLVDLNVEYMSWVFAEMDAWFDVDCEAVVGMPVDAYVRSVIDKVCDQAPPVGVFYLVEVDGQVAGMGGLRSLGPQRGEVKRIDVRPAFRGLRLGELVLARLLADATAFGHRRLCLDTAPFMRSAHRLYEQQGFADRGPYPEAEVPAVFHPRWRFMERSLVGA